MLLDQQVINAYIKRINYRGNTEVSFETLNGLHIAHTMNIPFENLDVFYKRPPLLDQESLVKKIVENNRGGYCFEMNGLFSIVLQELGFKVTNLLARGTFDGISYFAKLHQVLMVELDGKKYLADVGYGNDGIAAPLLLEEGVEQNQFTNTYRFVHDPTFGYVLQRKTEDGWGYMYAFTLWECYPMDFLMSNHFTATYPESFFLKLKFCTKPTLSGRITLTDEHFKVTENGVVTETKVTDDSEYNVLLKKHFGLDLDEIK
jgi:N-hydroxyarylamine O-acetyltransferase